MSAAPNPTDASADRVRTGLWVALGALCVAAAVLGAVLVLRDDGDAASDQDSETSADATAETIDDTPIVLLEAATDDGPDPFTASTSIVDLGSALTTTLQTVVAVDDGAPSPAGGVTIAGTAPGLYGGSGSQDVCDVEALATALGDPDDAEKATAWAEVEGIDVGDDTGQAIADHLDLLAPVVLRTDTMVTNHGFEPGSGAVPRQSVLQAGTAVLVDDTGLPRVRCACGNPLLAPTVDGSYRTEGEGWADWSAETTTSVAAGARVEALEVTDIDTGSLVALAVGPARTAPPPTAPPTTPPPTTAPPATAPPATDPPATSPPAPVLTDCGSVIFTPDTDDVAFAIQAVGVSCDEARALVTEVRYTHSPFTDPGPFERLGFACDATIQEEPIPGASFTCTSGERRVAWQG